MNNSKLLHFLRVLKRYIMNHKALFYGLIIIFISLGIRTFLSIMHGQINEIKKNGEIIFLTRNAPTTYYRDKDGELAGFEYDMANNFAKHLGVRAVFKTYDTVAELLKALQRGEGDIAAAGLSKTKAREEFFLFGPTYQKINQNLICHPNIISNPIHSTKKLDIVVIIDSSYLSSLEEVRKKNPHLSYQVNDHTSTEDLLEKVDNREIHCTMADSNIIEMHRHLYPYLKIYPINKVQSELSWPLNPKSRELKVEVKKWFNIFKISGKLASYLDRYYGHLKEYDAYDTKIFLERISTVLPKYRNLFEKSGEKYDIPWTFLASISYQESHWNPKAVSPTGVRGLMMLTKKTAEYLGVKNRLDPAESIDGGARYIKYLMDRIPDYIHGEERIWMALASYNMGFSHLQDARALAIWEGKNPNSWSDIRSMLPFLSQRKYFKKVPYGYARGMEALIYVRRIRNYHSMIQKHFHFEE